MRVPVPARLRITNGREGDAETLVMKTRAFQLTVEESQAAPDVVIGMHLSHIFPALIIYNFVLSMYI